MSSPNIRISRLFVRKSPLQISKDRSVFFFKIMLNYIRLYLFRHLLNIEQKNHRYVSQISSSSIKLNSTMKNLISNHQYKEALDLFDKQPSIHTDATLVLALKASTKSSDHQRGINIHQQLPLKSLKNVHIQTTLIHFYSKFSQNNF